MMKPVPEQAAVPRRVPEPPMEQAPDKVEAPKAEPERSPVAVILVVLVVLLGIAALVLLKRFA